MSGKKKKVVLLLPVLLWCSISMEMFAQRSGEIKKTVSSLRYASAELHKVALLVKLSDLLADSSMQNYPLADTALRYANDAIALARYLDNKDAFRKSYLAKSKALIRMKEQAILQNKDNQPIIQELYRTGQQLLQYKGKELPMREKGDIYMMLAGYYTEMDINAADIFQTSEKALHYYRETGYKQGAGEALQLMGRAKGMQGDLAEAEQLLLQSVALLRPTRSMKLQKAYSLLGTTLAFKGNYKQGLKYALEAEKAALRNNDTSLDMADVYNYIGINYEAIKDNQAALVYYRKALTVAEHFKELTMTYTIAANIGKIMVGKDPKQAVVFLENIMKKYPAPLTEDMDYSVLLSSPLLQGYLALGDLTNAGKYSRKLLQKSQSIPQDAPAQKRYLLPVVRYYMANAEYAEAEKHLRVLERMAKARTILPVLADVYLAWHQIDSAKGDMAGALEYYKAYKLLNDSFYNETKAKEIAQMQIEYETEQKSKSIALLSRQSELQKIQLKQAAFVRNAIITGVVVLVVLFVLLYRQYRNKQKASRIISSKNNELQKLVYEKDWLLKEIHHRVKNNLQIIVSLLESQSAYLKDEALSALQDSQNRVYAMSLIHKKLYQSENISAVNTAEYIPELVAYLKETDSSNIGFQLQVEAMELDASQAIPLGLIINEAVTNAMKYAFQGNKADSNITISLNRLPGDRILLRIADNGLGFDIATTSDEGLGIRLMNGLAGDMDGVFKIITDGGTVVSLEFHDNRAINNTAEIPLGNLKPDAA